MVSRALWIDERASTLQGKCLPTLAREMKEHYNFIGELCPGIDERIGY
jgi:hypothetical protein